MLVLLVDNVNWNKMDVLILLFMYNGKNRGRREEFWGIL